MAVRRFDRGTLDTSVRDAVTGYLRVRARMTRTGVFLYANPDGTIRRELRLPEDVFNADSLASFELNPVTDDHPPELLTAENTKLYQRGTVDRGVRAEDPFVAGDLLLTDAELIAKVLRGKVEISNGYECDLEPTPGVYNGEPYDVIQRNIRGNHVAVVARGRAGRDARIKLDSQDAVLVEPENHNPPHKDQTTMVTITINGKEYQVSPEAAQAITAYIDQQTASASQKTDAIAKLTKERDTAQAKADAAEGELTKEKQKRADAENPANVAKLVNDRVSLITSASRFVPKGTKFDTLDERGIKVLALQKLVPDFKADAEKHSLDYITARFDAAVAIAEKENPALAAAREVSETAPADRTDADPVVHMDEAAARKNMLTTYGKMGRGANA